MTIIWKNSFILFAIDGIPWYFRRSLRNIYDNRKPLIKKNVSTVNVGLDMIWKSTFWAITYSTHGLPVYMSDCIKKIHGRSEIGSA